MSLSVMKRPAGFGGRGGPATKKRPAACDPSATTTVKKRPAGSVGGHLTDDVVALDDQLSVAGTLNEKIKLLQNEPNLGFKEKLALMNKSLNHNDWMGIHQKARNAADKDPALADDLAKSAATGGAMAVRANRAAWVLDPTKGDAYKDACGC